MIPTLPRRWAPPGSTAEHLAANVIATGDFVLVHKSHGVWALSSAEDTQRHSFWAEVLQRQRRVFTVRIAGQDWPVAVRRLADKVVRRTGDQMVARMEAILSSGAPDAMDQALETAFPSAPEEGAEVLARNGARVHWRKTSWSGLTVCGLDVDSLANGHDGPKCQECFPTKELETWKDKIRGHLEAARASTAAAIGTPYYREILAAEYALEALARDLGI